MIPPQGFWKYYSNSTSGHWSRWQTYLEHTVSEKRWTDLCYLPWLTICSMPCPLYSCFPLSLMMILRGKECYPHVLRPGEFQWLAQFHSLLRGRSQEGLTPEHLLFTPHSTAGDEENTIREVSNLLFAFPFSSFFLFCFFKGKKVCYPYNY